MTDITRVAYVMLLSGLQLTAGQLPNTESLRNVTHCDLNSALNIACGTDELIVIHSIKLAYNVTCDGTCCNTYSSSDCFAAFGADLTREFRRACSGQQTCTAPTVKKTTDFCAFGVKDVSYVFLQYYCIPESRTLAMCATGAIPSDGPPLYITSENYPGVTIGSRSCACSIEANSCSSSITVYEADIDLYLDTNNCQQNVVFKNGTDGVLATFGCESYDTEFIISRAINSHYGKIEFNNTSTANQEGFFLLGLKASEDGVSFTLSCTSVSQSWCVGCGPLQSIANGIVELRVKDDTSYGSIADVNCDNGYGTTTPTISCQDNNTWPDAVCTVKAACTAGQWRCTNGDCIADSERCDNIPDCSDDSDEQNCQISPTCPEGWESCQLTNGSYACVETAVGCCGPVPVIANGSAVLSANTSIANVLCDEGYQESTPTITCQPSRVWDQATCNAVDCGPAPTVKFGNITLDTGTTSFESTATVQCETGYEPSIPKISCLSSGHWEIPKCRPEVSTTPSSRRKTSIDVILIIIIVLVGLALVQFSIVTFFQCRIHRIRKKASDEESQMPKRVFMIMAGSVPVFGVIAIYFSGKVFYTDVYKVSHPDRYQGHMNMAMNSNNEYKNVPPDSKSIPVDKTDSVSHGKPHHGGSEISDETENPVHTEHVNLEETESSNGLINNETQQQDIALSNPTFSSAPSRQQAAVNGTMIRGLSATFDDKNNDMDTYLHRPKLSPIPQYHESDHRHHHFSQDVERRRQQLHDVAEQARKQGKHVEFVREKLYINNCLYQPEHHNQHNGHNTVKFF